MSKIAIVSTNKNKYSETFIHNHVKLLPAEVHYLFNGYLPRQYKDDRFFAPQESADDINLLKKSIAKYLLNNGIEAVLAEYGPSGVEMMDICAETKTPLIVHFHGYDAYRNDMMRDFGKGYEELFRKAAAIVAVSHHMMNRLRDLGAPSEKLFLNTYGPDETKFTISDPSKAPPRFLAVSRFAETKSPHLTLLAFHETVKKIPEAALTMVGDGHLLEACKILTKALKIAEKVEFPGVLKHEEVATEMRKSRGFVQHSVTTPENDTEGTPVAILEAGASGLPVVATRHAGIPDVVLDGVTGWLVDEFDIKSMSEKMIHLANNASRAKEMGEAAFKRVKEEFTLQRHIDNLWKIIESAINDRA